METKADYFFEASWEVCNKVGGIYTVITSKINRMIQFYKFNYYTIGPYFSGNKLSDQFKEKTPPDFLKEVFEELHKQGIVCYFGTWLLDAEPNVILIDYSGYQHNINNIKRDLWDNYQIDSINTQYHDYDEPILWSTCVGILLEAIKGKLGEKKIAAQFHEWLAGGALLYLKSKGVKIGTVFTTHATMLGRTLAANNIDLYNLLDKLNPEEMAYKFKIPAKYLTERECAKNADVFTTVSEITGIEATTFFGKKPDVLLPNGLDKHSFPAFDEASVKHKKLKNKIKKFIMFYFFPYYQFDLDNTLTFFLAGRNEFENKGIDIYIDALGKLNQQMKHNGSNKTILAFIWVPTGIKEIKHEILENRTFFEDIEDSIEDVADEIKDRVLYGLVGNQEISKSFLLGEAQVKLHEKRLARLKREGNPPLCTHDLYNEENDKILNAIKKNELYNTPEDKVKIVFYPIYLTGADRLTDLTYYEGIMASHLGVFPSYYEPWGYTPLEAGALGIASVTTDLAGFGRYIKSQNKKVKNQGIYVLDRQDKPYETIVDSLVKVFKQFASATKQDRIENKMRAKKLADTADWSILADNYLEAHNLAVERNG